MDKTTADPFHQFIQQIALLKDDRKQIEDRYFSNQFDFF